MQRIWVLITSCLMVPLTSFAMSLDQAFESTLQKNETVGQSRARVRQAEEAVTQIRGAILPNVSMVGTYLRQPRLDDPFLASFSPESQTTMSLMLTQPLFRGFREFAAVRRQDDRLAAQRFTSLTEMMALYQSVAENFMEILALEQDLRNIEEQQKIYRTRVRDLQGRTRRGESAASEALTAQSTAAALDAEYQLQRAKLVSTRENFSYLTGLTTDAVLTDDGGDTMPALQELDAYLTRVDERPDIKVLKARLEAAGEDVSIANGAHWPTLDFVGNYYLQKPDGFMKDLKWDAKLSLVFPLYEGGVRQSEVRAAASKRGENELALAQARRKATAEIKSLHESLRMRSDQLKFLKQASDLSEKNYRTLLGESRRGLLRSLDVQLGLTEYRVARRTYDQARFQARLERIRIDLATANIPTLIKSELTSEQ